MTRPSEGGATLEAFVAQVQDRASLRNPEEADQVCRATLATLAESVSSGQLDDLTQGLPPELTADLRAGSGQAKAMDKPTFIDRVSGSITTVDPDATEQQARAVLATLAQWAPSGEIDNVIAQLPPAVADLFSSPGGR